MKYVKKITALLLALAIGFSVCSVSFTTAAEEAKEPKNLIEYKEMLDEEGYPAMTTEQFMGIAGRLNSVCRTLTGRGNIPQEHFNFVVDEILQEACGYIADETGLDVLLMLANLPETNQYAEFVVSTFNIDTASMRDEIYKIRDKIYDGGQQNLAYVFHLLGVYLSIIDECKAYCAPYDEWGNDWYEVHLKITMRDGTAEDVATGMMINPETGEICGKNDDGMFGIGYNFSVYELLVYAPVNVWMRDFGFTAAYDLFCYTTPFFFYNTRRIKFDYEGREWMIQIWKGNYLVTNGAEVGIYNRDAKKFGSYYDCAGDEDMMKMSMELYHGDELIFERPEQTHWWLTGFKVSDTLYPAETMTLRFSIEMKDEAMLSAFCKAVENHYKQDMTYTVDGLTVNVVW